jgi:hypothetical protein
VLERWQRARQRKAILERRNQGEYGLDDAVPLIVSIHTGEVDCGAGDGMSGSNCTASKPRTAAGSVRSKSR